MNNSKTARKGIRNRLNQKPIIESPVSIMECQFIQPIKAAVAVIMIICMQMLGKIPTILAKESMMPRRIWPQMGLLRR